MSVIHDYRLTHCSMRILEYLLYYRGMTALQLSQMYYEIKEPMPTQKSNIHNYLSKLKKKGLINSKKTNDPLHVGSLYYLSSNGLDVAKDLLNIELEANGTGYIYLNNSSFQAQADLPYEIYAPPRKQIEHHLLLIDFFNVLRTDFYEEDYIPHRLSMYCSVEYIDKKKETKIRPDAEIMLPNGDCYWIEIDRATESHAQLMTKFYNYKNYFLYLKQNNLPFPLKGILFVTNSKERTNGLKRRWASLLSAFIKVMHPDEIDVRLLFTSLTNLESTLRFEMQRDDFKNQAAPLLMHHYNHEEHMSIQSFNKITDNHLLGAFIIKPKTYRTVYLNISNTFDSSAYMNFLYFLNIEKDLNKHESIQEKKFQGLERIIFYKDERPFLLTDLHGGSTDTKINDMLEQLSTNLEFIKLP